MITKLHFYRDGLLLIMTAWLLTKRNGHLLRAATAFFYFKVRQSLLQFATTGIIKCDD